MSVHANYFTLQLKGSVPEDRQVLPWLVLDYKKSHCSVEVVIFRYGVEMLVSL